MAVILALYKKRRAGLKKLTLLFLASVLSLFLLSTISCNNLFENPLEEKTSESEEPETINNPELKRLGKSGIYISLVQPESLQQNLASRTVLPDIDTSTLTAIRLSGSRNGEDSINIGVWDSFSQMAGLIELDAGEWDLELSASSNNFVFRDIKHVSLSVGQTQRVSFALNTSAGGGGIDFKISFPANVQKLEYTFYRYSSGSFTSIENAPNAVIRTEGTGKYFTFQRTSSNPVDPGTYKLELRFWGDTAKTQLLNTFCELINVKAGFISRSTDRSINLNQMHTITYKTENGSDLNASEYTIKDSLGNNTSLPVNYTANSGTITLPVLEKTGYIFEGWYTTDGSGKLSSSPVTRIAETDSGDKEFRAVFIIEMKEGSDFNTIVKQWTAAEKFLPSATAPAVTPSYYLDTATNVPVWYDTTSHNVYFYCAGYTDSAGTKKLILRPDSSKLFQNARYSEINLSYFDTSRVTNMEYMFQNATGLYNINLSGFNTANVTDMNHMFAGASNLREIYVSDTFVTGAVENDSYMFSGNSNLKGENNTAFSAANTGKTYARFDIAGSPGYFSHVPASTVYYITYELNDGTNAPGNPASYTSTSLPITLANPGRQNTLGDNFIFDGWYTSSTFASGTQVTTISNTSYGNVTLYAKWKVPYRVKHMQQNVTGSDYTEAVSDLQVLYGYAGENTSAAAMSYTGFTVQTVIQKPIAADGSTVVEIKYDRRTYTVTYDDGLPDKDLFSTINGSYRYGATVTVARFGSTEYFENQNPGYSFTGWKYGSIDYPKDVTASFEMPASNVTLTAQWSLKTYTIDCRLNGGSWADAYSPPATYNINSPDITLPTAENVVRDGYIFTGWYLNSSGTGTKYIKVPAGSYNNKIYYAGWVDKVLSVSTVDAAITAIQNAPSGQTVKVTCTLSSDNTELAQIVAAIKDKSTPVGLDLSQTGMTEITTSFFRVDYLCNIVLPDALTKLGNGVFNMSGGSVPAYSITIPKNCTDVSPGTRSLCGNFSNIFVESENTAYKDINGVLFDIDGELIYDYPAGRAVVDSYEIPYGVQGIMKDSFSGRSNIKNIIIPNTVALIEQSAFSNNSGALTSVKVNVSATINISIRGTAFAQNSKLETFEFTGTKSEWNASIIDSTWLGVNNSNSTKLTAVKCYDGNSTHGFEYY